MTKLPPSNIIAIFIRNRRAGGWPPQRIATAIRTRLKLDSITADMLDCEQRDRYDKITALLIDLETPTPP